MFFTWSRWLAKQQSTIRKPYRRAKFIPWVEQLESRLTPSGSVPITISATPAALQGYEFIGTVGQPFSETLSGTEKGYSGTYTFSRAKTSGGNYYSMPPGLALATGGISGTPTTPGQYNVCFLATDGNGNTDSTVFQFLINQPATIASGSNNAALPLSSPANSINVSSTAGFPQSGAIEIQTGAGVTTLVHYNGLNTAGTAFLNCTGGTGTLQTGDFVTLAATIASGSNNVMLPVSSSPANINVSSTAGFPSTGSLYIQTGAGTTALLQYTGKTATTIENCTGGSGTLLTGDLVTMPATIASGSNNVMLPVSGYPANINVSSTTGFPSTGSLYIQTGAGTTTLVQYIGKTATAFENCTGGSGTLQTGDLVYPSTTVPPFSVSTTMQGLNPLNDLQYNNQVLPLGIIDQPYNAAVTPTDPSDPITNVQITTYLNQNQPPVPVGSQTLAGIDVTSSGTNTYNIYGLDGTSGPALSVSLTSGNVVSITGTPTFERRRPELSTVRVGHIPGRQDAELQFVYRVLSAGDRERLRVQQCR